MPKCPVCNGKGEIKVDRTWQPCPVCGGGGRISSDPYPEQKDYDWLQRDGDWEWAEIKPERKD